MRDNGPYLTVEEIADELRVSIPSVWRWIRANKLPALKVGRRYLVSRKDYKVFLAAHRKQPPSG